MNVEVFQKQKKNDNFFIVTQKEGLRGIVVNLKFHFVNGETMKILNTTNKYKKIPT